MYHQVVKVLQQTVHARYLLVVTAQDWRGAVRVCYKPCSAGSVIVMMLSLAIIRGIRQSPQAPPLSPSTAHPCERQSHRSPRHRRIPSGLDTSTTRLWRPRSTAGIRLLRHLDLLADPQPLSPRPRRTAPHAARIARLRTSSATTCRCSMCQPPQQHARVLP